MNQSFGRFLLISLTLLVLATSVSASWLSKTWHSVGHEISDNWDNLGDTISDAWHDVRHCCSVHGRVSFHDTYYVEPQSHYYIQTNYTVPAYYTPPAGVWYVHPRNEPAYIVYNDH